ncbi:MAG: hypothetical protein V1734_00480 [Nanoarchaeota archaeon]
MKKLNAIKFISVIVVTLFFFWYFFMWALDTDTDLRRYSRYNEAIESSGTDDLHAFSLCNPEDMPDLCSYYGAFAELDGNPGFSVAEDQLRKSVHLLAHSAAESHEKLQRMSWLVIVLSAAFVVNLLFDIKNKK